MKYRNILKDIEPLLGEKQIIAICGMRRTGKTTLIKYLLGKSSNNKIYFDLERVEYRYLFSDPNYQNIVQSLEIEGIDFSKRAFIGIDEIQLVPEITSVIKYLYDNYNIKFYITGSSSFYMKHQFSESLAGRKFLFELNTLSFDEFLQFKDVNLDLPVFSYQKVNKHIFTRLSTHYNEYINFGGFPEVTFIENPDTKVKYLHDILNSYLNLDIKYLADFKTTDEIYKLLRLLSVRTGSKADYSKISGLTGINRKKIKEYLLFLESTFFLRLVPPYVTNTDREIAKQNKIYFSDNGLLTILGKISSGALFENMIANQLYRLGDLNYYSRKTGQEIDFIINKEIAVEAKETPNESDLRTLSLRAGKLRIKQSFLAGKYIPQNGFDDFIWGGNIY